MDPKNCQALLIDDDPDMHLVVKLILEPDVLKLPETRYRLPDSKAG